MFRTALQSFGPLFLASMLTGCGRDAGRPSRRLGAMDAPGLHNVFRLTDRLLSGSAPEGDEGFASLQRLGVKTVLTVDGARPDVARARRFGLRYVHLPIGYDGVPERQGRRIARAVRDLPGPVYVHCHHGKHRGPAAVAVVRLCLDPSCSVETAIEEMRRAGADPRYAGLYAAPRDLRRPTAAELDALPADFPEAVGARRVHRARWSRSTNAGTGSAARAAGWKTPPDHPDIDPPHEALLLAEGYQESIRLPATRHRPEEFLGRAYSPRRRSVARHWWPSLAGRRGAGRRGGVPEGRPGLRGLSREISRPPRDDQDVSS